jgi:hypothetical protein
LWPLASQIEFEISPELTFQIVEDFSERYITFREAVLAFLGVKDDGGWRNNPPLHPSQEGKSEIDRRILQGERRG